MMKLPQIQGIIDRRMLINFRVDPDVLSRQLPDPFRPHVVNGQAMLGICLIRLKHIRPTGFPAWAGLRSENAAHRAAVEWEQNGHTHRGVFIWRRDTSSCLNVIAGGRMFPGVHHHARFTVQEADARLQLSMRSGDGLSVDIQGQINAQWPASSVFASRDDASAFFQAGAVGYSPSHRAGRFDGLELECDSWNVESLAIDTARSSFFQDSDKWPAGTVNFDNALLMRRIHHRWHQQPDLCACTAESADG